jgi:hypothetical protein
MPLAHACGGTQLPTLKRFYLQNHVCTVYYHLPHTEKVKSWEICHSSMLISLIYKVKVSATKVGITMEECIEI